MQIKSILIVVSFFVLMLAQVGNAADMYIRGTHNNWVAQPMTCSSGDGFWLNCEAVVVFGSNAEFKFDHYGNWKENFGDNTNVRGLNPVRGWEGHYGPGEGNIKVQGNKTYRVHFSQSSGGPRRDSSNVYSLEELPAQPTDLPKSVNILLRNALITGGMYGAEAVSGELLVRNLSYHKRVIITYTSGNETSTIEASFAYTLHDDVEVWIFSAGGFGTGKYFFQYQQLDNNGITVNTYTDNNKGQFYTGEYPRW